jgi:hypothetical protein
MKAACTTNSKLQDSLRQVLAEDHHHQFQVDRLQAFLHQGFLILHTDISLLHIPIYHRIMAHMEGTCLY